MARYHSTVNPRVLIPHSWSRLLARDPALACISSRTPPAFPAALEDCFRFGEEVLVEEFFPGRELTVGILGDEALPIIEIVPREGFYDYEHKYTKGASRILRSRRNRRLKRPRPSSTPLYRPSAPSGSRSIPASMCFSPRTAA